MGTFWGMEKEPESLKGEYNRLMEFHENIRPGVEKNEESLKDLFDKFNKRGINLNNNVDYQATKQASITLSRNMEFNTLDPSNPKEAAQREKMLIDETARLKRGMTGRQSSQPAPVSSEEAMQELRRRGLVK